MTLVMIGELTEEKIAAQDAALEDIWDSACSDVDANQIDWQRIHACPVYRTGVIERLRQLVVTEADVTPDRCIADEEF
jgi:hypothetical protein